MIKPKLPRVNRSIDVDATQVQVALKIAQASIEDMTEFMDILSKEIAQSVRDQFEDGGESGTSPWAHWSKWTVEWRSAPPRAAISRDSAAFQVSGNKRKDPNLSYYGRKPSIGINKIGIWTGEMRDWFAGKGGVGFTEIEKNSLRMGVSETSDSVKAERFVLGRKEKKDGASYFAYAEALRTASRSKEKARKGNAKRETLATKTGDIRRYTPEELERMADDFLSKAAMSSEMPRDEAVEISKLASVAPFYPKTDNWRVHYQFPRPVYEGIDFKARNNSNPIHRAVKKIRDYLLAKANAPPVHHRRGGSPWFGL